MEFIHLTHMTLLLQCYKYCYGAAAVADHLRHSGWDNGLSPGNKGSIPTQNVASPRDAEEDSSSL